MADLSLDEFIRRSNVKVRVSNNQQTNRKGKLQKNPSLLTKNGGNTRLGKKFDARSKLGPKAIVDARDKIVINKKNGVGDARNKIVQKQVQKGTFDARSLLQRQTNKQGGKGIVENFVINTSQTGVSGNISLHRTLQNPGAQGKGQVRVTENTLLITRPLPKTEVSISAGGSIQVTNRSRSLEGSMVNSIPIIQIRNDRYKQPGQQPLPQQSQSSQHYSQSLSRQPLYPEYDMPSHSQTTYGTTHPRGYRDYDDPHNNEASIAIPEIPKIKPITYQKEFSQTRAPPGAATVSQAAKQPTVKTILQPSKPVAVGVKRKAPEVAGPLRLGRGGGPGIDLAPVDTLVSKKIKVAPLSSDVEVIDVDIGSEVISPLQGFRVMVTNLYNGVTQDDIIELFGAVGPLKKAKLLKPGSAEVVYVSREDAISAVQKYHSRELDGQPMSVKMTTPWAAVVKKAVGDNDPDITGEALRLYKKMGSGSLPEAPVEIPTIHRALFKAGPQGPSKSVKFTVKI